jgi:hypothetical protein
MIRDGRAAAYSLIQRLKESNNYVNFKRYLSTWNSYNSIVLRQCRKVGSKCLKVKYEDLVTDTKNTLKKVVNFLDLSWTDEFLHHEKYVGNKIVVSQTEWSTDQIKQKIYTESLRNWVGNVNYNENEVRKLFPMLSELGYNFN